MVFSNSSLKNQKPDKSRKPYSTKYAVAVSETANFRRCRIPLYTKNGMVAAIIPNKSTRNMKTQSRGASREATTLITAFCA